MRDGVRIVNAARGGLIDEVALAAAVRSGKVAGAALDVFESEPYSGPLLQLEQIVVTPHLAGSTSEAQDRAGLIIAEQVAAALDGELVQTAVNIPVVEQADLEMLGAFIPLAAKLGRLAIALDPWASRPDRGRGTRAALRVRHPPAHGRGSERCLPGPRRPDGELRECSGHRRRTWHRRLRAALRGFPALHEPRAGAVAGEGEEIEVSGTTIGPEPRLFLAGALGFAIDIELAPRMAFLVYDDLPGVIGRVGTMFGEAGVNIANMAVSRTKEGGKALMAFSIDSAPPPELLERVQSSGFDEARFITLA